MRPTAGRQTRSPWRLGETAWSTQLGHWGDSADAAVDPRDDTTFWATNSIVTGDQARAAPVAHFTTADPVGVSQLPGTFDVRAIDALIATQEAGQVPQAERADVAGTTAYKWGGSAGEGVALTYSFAGPETTFSDTYDARTDDIREAPEGFKETVHESLDSWSDVADVTFTEVQGGGDIQIVITGSHPRFEDGKQRGEAFGPAPGPRAGDVWLSPEAAEEWDAALIHHELAHPIFGFMDTSAAAGLSGATLPPETNFRTHTVMSYEVLPGHEVGNEPGATRGGAEPWPDTPMVLDIQAAQALYGANDSHNSDNDVYTFDGDAVHRTIWDASGKDRLDASGQTDPVTIDLRPGKYSDVGAPVDIQVADGGHTLEHTLGIAHGTVVENADGGTGDDRLTGNAAHNVLRGGRGSDEIDGGDGRDVLHGNGLGGTDDAPDVLDGGPDVDTAAFEVTHDSAEVGEDGGVRTVSIDGTVDKLIDVERLQFADGTLAFDADGSSGQVYRLYEAVFDRVPEAEGLGFWVKQLDGGERSYREMVESFLAAPEYAERYGAGQSDTAFVETVYRNVLDRAPDNAGNAYWLDQLAEGMPRAKMIADFAESDENRIAVNTAFEDGVWLV